MRSKRFPRFLPSLALGLAAVTTVACAGREAPTPASRVLSDGWRLQPAAAVAVGGEALSTVGFDVSPWLEARVPTTPMAALVAAGRYPDLYLGTNLEAVDTAQFRQPWWYRTEFELTADEAARTARLAFDGVNYAADVWLNGELVAGREQVVGAFRTHSIDVSGRLVAGRNALAVAVHPPQPGDFTIGFVDWNPRPPDANMGLWRPVTLRLTGDVSIDDLAVRTDLDLPDLASARLTISATVTNHGGEPATATVGGRIEDRSFAAEVTLAPHEARVVAFEVADHEELRVQNPRVWWPHTMGSPELYELAVQVTVGGEISDTARTSFGIREVGTYLNDEGHRGFTVNGVPVLIRGGGWVDDLLLADTPEKIDAQLAYVTHMGLNTIRLEGFWGTSQYLYDAADRKGLLIMPGWSCQWEWEDYLGKPVSEQYGGVLEPAEMDLVAASLGDQIRYLRNHPSIFVWVLASDLLPHPDLERRYQKVLAELDTTRPPLVSCGWLESEVSGHSGVKMSGPYDWVPPRYWWEDREHGGAYGFNTETGPGPQPPPLESVQRMIPPDHLWPIDDVWNYHCGRNEFNDLDRYVEALDRRYGPSQSAAEFSFKAQVANYEAIRPMFESFAANRPLTTGLIQWMLNSAWPEMYWQLYDWYLMPSGAFYGTRAACRQHTLVYDYAEQTVVAVNDSRHPVGGLVASVRVFDLGANEILSEEIELDLEAGRSRPVRSLAELSPPSPVYFLDLRLRDPAGEELSRNFYWLSARPDVLDYENNLWFVTPTKQFADFTALGSLPTVPLDVAADITDEAGGARVRATLSNPSEDLAFFVELRVVGADDRSILPVLWDDNYVSILPGETRELAARFPFGDDVSGAVLAVRGWNVQAIELKLGGR